MMDNPKILIIDDDVGLCESTRNIIELEGYSVDISHTAEDGIKKVESVFYNIILLNKKLPNAHGLVVLDKIKEISPDTEVIIFTAYAETENVIEAMNKNAFAYLHKPLEISYLKTTLRKACEKQKLLFENRKLLQQVFDAKNDWETTFDSISDLISIHDENFNIIRCNKALGRKFNAEPKDLIGKKCYEIFHGSDKPHPACPLARCKETSKPETEEIDDPNMGGVFLISSFPRFDKKGGRIGYVEICRDITEQKEFEKYERLLTDRLSKSEAKYRELFETITDGIVFVAVEGRILDCNKGYLDMLGYSIEEIRSKKYQDITPPEWHDMEEKIVRTQIMERGYSDLYDKEYIRKDGTVFPISIRVWVTKGANDKVNGMWAIVRDITERKKIENVLQESEEQFRSTFEHAGVGIVHVAPNGQFLRMNKLFCDIFGHSEDKMLKLTFQDITHSDELEIDTNLANQLLDGKIKTYTIEKRYLKEDGTVIWVNLTISIVHKPEGGPKYFICIAENITERKQMEQTLQESEQRFRTISNTANEGIIMVDNAGNISFWNKAAERIFGYSSEEAVGESLHKLVIPSHLQERLLEGFKRFRNTGQGPFVGRTVELTAIKKDGTELPIEHSISAVKLKGKWHAVGIIRDITERKQAEEKVKQSLVKLKTAMNGTISALALTVEQRDPYTAGHQQRVSLLACAIADEMGLSEDQIEGIRMAGIVHDIGKMHIPAEILSRPGKLNENEYNIVKSHAQVGYDILKGIEFPWPVADIVHQHHESMDGSGYPSGLSNGDILMEARILCVADVVEAMASHRPYRPALGMDIALEEISEDKGVRYDSGVVDACLKVIKEKGFKFDSRPGQI